MFGRLNQVAITGGALVAIGPAFLSLSLRIDLDPGGGWGARTFPLIGSVTVTSLGFVALIKGVRAAPAHDAIAPDALRRSLMFFALACAYVLLRARAIETQSWVVAAAQTGDFPVPDGRRQMFGRSMIIDPWGTVVAQVSDEPGWATAIVDADLPERVRARMPTLQHRRHWNRNALLIGP